MGAQQERRWSRTIAIWLAATAVAAVPFVVAPAAMAAAGLAAQIVPASLTLAPGDAAGVDLVLSNSGGAPVTVTGIDVVTPPRLAGAVTGLRLPWILPAGSSARGLVQLRAASGMQDSQVAVLTEYRSGSATHVVAATLTVGAVDVTALPEVTFVTAPEKVNDGQSRRAVVRLANPTSVEYEKVALLAIDSDDLDVELLSAPQRPFTTCRDGASPEGPGRALACLDRLAPGASHLVELTIRAHDSVRTGRQTIGLRFTGTPAASPSGTASPSANASRSPGTGVSPAAGSSAAIGVPSAGALPAANVVGTAQIELTVFGVDALSPFGVGTLFVLPGILAVLVFLILGRYVYPRRPGLPDTVDLKDLRALPVVVPSAALVYLLVWLLWGRNLTITVGTADVALLFGLGLLLGTLAWAAMAGAWYERVGRKQFSLNDSPDLVLRRLAARHSRLALPEVRVSNVRHLYLARGAGGTLLISPQLAYTVLGDPAAASTGENAKTFRAAIRRDDIDAVRAAWKAGHVRIRWDGPSNLTEIDGSGVQLADNQSLLVERQ